MMKAVSFTMSQNVKFSIFKVGEYSEADGPKKSFSRLRGPGSSMEVGGLALKLFVKVLFGAQKCLKRHKNATFQRKVIPTIRYLTN